MPGLNLFKRFLPASAHRKMQGVIIQVYGLRLGGAALGYVVQVVLAFHLGAANYGIFALAWILATVVAQLASSGFNETTNRFLPGYLIQGDLARARGFVLCAKRFTTLVSLTATLIGFGLLYFFSGSTEATYFWPIALALLCVPFACRTHLLEAICISRSWMIKGLAPTYILRPVVMMAIVTVAVTFAGLPATAATAVGALLVACVGVAILQGWLSQKPLQAELGAGEGVYENRSWIFSSLLLIMSQGFVILATNIDVLMLGMLASSEDVGVYFAAAKSVAVVSFISIAVGNVVVRRLSESTAMGETTAFAETFATARKWMLWPSVLLGMAVTLAAPLFMKAFGPEFAGGTTLVAILMCGVYIQVVAGPVQQALVVLGMQRQLAIATVLCIALNIGLNFALVLWIGVVGAAIASIIATAFRVVYLWYLIPAEFRSPPPHVEASGNS